MSLACGVKYGKYAHLVQDVVAYEFTSVLVSTKTPFSSQPHMRSILRPKYYVKTAWKLQKKYDRENFDTWTKLLWKIILKN
jgi:hypothetical protein